jgi:hypothetical protein
MTKTVERTGDPPRISLSWGGVHTKVTKSVLGAS